MVSKASLKKINNMIQWIVGIAMIAIGIYYFFISKGIFKQRLVVIMWGCVGIMNAGSIIDSKYFKDNFSWKSNWVNILQVFFSAVVIVMMIISMVID